MLQSLLDNMPHGSGINDKWTYRLGRDNAYLYNSFYCMGENGFYDGYADFGIAITKDYLLDGNWQKIAAEFRLTFLSDKSQRLARRYDLRNYLEDIFTEFFKGL